MKLVLFSDVHYCSEPPIHSKNAMERKLFNYALSLIKKLKTEVNKIHPDALISLGDLIEDLKDHDKDIINIKYIWQEIKKELPCPLYHALGNHEMRTVKREEIEKAINQKATFSIDIKGVQLIFITPQIQKNTGISVDNDNGGIFRTNYIAEEELEWLEKDLQSSENPCVIFTHFGIAEDSMKGNWWFGGTGVDVPNSAFLGNRKELKEILKKHKDKILAVFNGHQHWTKKINEDGIDYYILGSLTENMKDDGKPDGVYYLVEIVDGKISVKENHLAI